MSKHRLRSTKDAPNKIVHYERSSDTVEVRYAVICPIER